MNGSELAMTDEERNLGVRVDSSVCSCYKKDKSILGTIKMGIGIKLPTPYHSYTNLW